MYLKPLEFFLLCLLTVSGYSQGTDVFNRGEFITIKGGTTLVIKGNYINEANAIGAPGEIINLGSITLEGDLINNASDNSVFVFVSALSSGTVVFSGSGPQAIGGTYPTHFYRVELNKTGNLNLNQSLTVNDQLRFSMGNVNLNGHIIDLRHTGYLTGEYDASRVFGSAGHILTQRIFTANEDVAGLGLSIDNANAGLTTLKRFHQPINSGDGSVARWFELTADRTSDDVTVQISYLEAELNGQDEDEFDLWKGTLDSVWRRQGGIVNTSENFVSSAMHELSTALLTVAEKNCITVPAVDLGEPEIATCQDSVILLDAGFEELEHLWSNGARTSSIEVTETGTYSVEVTTRIGCIGRDEVSVDFKPLPVPDFETSTPDGCMNSELLFTNTSHVADESPLSYVWNFGDQAVSTEENPAYAYDHSDIFTVSLTARTSSCQRTISKAIRIHPLPEPVFSVGSLCVNEPVIFTQQSTLGGGIPGIPYALTGFKWNLGDGVVASGESIAHTYVHGDAYSVTLEVSSNTNCTASVTQLITISQKPIADFEVITACAGAGTEFTNRSLQADSFHWRFGDGNTSSLRDVIHFFGESRPFLVELSARNKGCEAIVSKEVTPYPIPEPALHSVTTCGTTVTLDAGNPGSAYAWSHGAASQRVIIAANGTYHVKVTNIHGCIISDSATVTLNAPFTPSLGDDREVCGQAQLNAFNPNSTYLWLPSGETSAVIDVSESGTYVVEVTDENGCIGTDEIQLVIHEVPFVNLGADRFICASESAFLDAGNPGAQYTWSNQRREQAIIVQDPGFYEVEVFNGKCTARDGVQVHVDRAISPDLETEIEICRESEIALNAGNNPTAVYRWFDDAGAMIYEGIAFAVRQPGQLVLEASTEAGCFERKEISIIESPHAISADFLAASTVNAGEVLKFINVSYPAERVKLRSWQFHSDAFSFEEHPELIFTAEGIYPVALTVQNDVCESTIIRNIEVISGEQKIEDSGRNASGRKVQHLIDLTLSPNPSMHEPVTFKVVTGETQGRIKVIATDLSGKIYYHNEFNGNGPFAAEFDTVHFIPGVYVLFAITDGGEVRSERIIIMD